MIDAVLPVPDDFAAWRELARDLVLRDAAPDRVAWRDGAAAAADLFAAPPADPGAPAPRSAPVRASRGFVALAKSVIMHRSEERLALLYRTLWRLQTAPRLLEDQADPDVRRLAVLAKQIGRDIHKMRAFVRFRAVPEADGVDHYLAWFEPDHRIERANVPFFTGRFANQRWSILTPRLSLHWDGAELTEGPPADRHAVPAEDATEDLWRGYYRSIFNPARLKVAAMVKEMPRRYWHNLPEARDIASLIAGAQQREAAMIATGGSSFAQEPPPASLAEVASGIAACRRCPIGCNGTRAVMGEGPADAALMIVGEQPGDTEETHGRPFIGPAGEVLDRQLAAAGIARGAAYLTNAVKHFKFTPRGQRRLHQTPTAGEIDHCRWWLDAERALVRPRTILALGASAARGLLGRTPSIARERGRPLPLPDGGQLWLTAHPSYLLRLDGEAAAREEAHMAEDLAALRTVLDQAAQRA